MGYICSKICGQKRSKIDQSGHTDDNEKNWCAQSAAIFEPISTDLGERCLNTWNTFSRYEATLKSSNLILLCLFVCLSVCVCQINAVLELTVRGTVLLDLHFMQSVLFRLPLKFDSKLAWMTGLKNVSNDTTMGLVKETKNVNMAKGFLPIYLSNVYPDTSLLTTFPPFVGR